MLLAKGSERSERLEHDQCRKDWSWHLANPTNVASPVGMLITRGFTTQAPAIPMMLPLSAAGLPRVVNALAPRSRPRYHV